MDLLENIAITKQKIKSQSYRRFPIITLLRQDDISVLLNKGVFDDDINHFGEFIQYTKLVGNFQFHKRFAKMKPPARASTEWPAENGNLFPFLSRGLLFGGLCTGEKGYNYRSERFANRLARDPRKWKEQQRNPFSRIIPLQGGVSIGNKFDIELLGGAGCPGDYLYRLGSFAWDVESGMWGIFRVMKQTLGCRCKGMCRKIKDCFR